MKTAFVHDWLLTKGGAEKVLEEIEKLFPGTVYTLMNGMNGSEKEVKTSFLQRLPLKYYRYYLPFFTRAIESLDLSGYDLILSNSHAVAKGVKKRDDQLHICYCHTPMRYAWDLENQYMEDLGILKKSVAKWVLHRLRKWDRRVSDRVDHFIANSQFVAKRIERIYGRKAEVIYPPVATEKFYLSEKKEEFYLTVSRLVPYKRIDLIVEAFSKLGKRLIVVGDGPEMMRIKPSQNVEMLGHQSDGVIAELMSQARGFVFAAEEDFGIVPVEAQASGTPVIAFGKGGALETVIEGKTGLFFKEQTVDSLVDGIRKFEQMEWNSKEIKGHAEKFNGARFRIEYSSFVNQKWGEFCENRHLSGR